MSLLLKLVGAATQPVVIHDYRVRGSVVVTSWIPVAPVAVQGVTTSYVVRGSQGINSWSYVVPTAAGAVDTPVNPGVGSLVITGYAPTVTQGVAQAVNPGAGSLTITGYAPTVTQASGASYGVLHSYVTRGSQSIVSWLSDGISTPNGNVNPGAGSLTITGHAPTVAQTTGTAVNPGVGSLALTGYAPTVTQSSSASYGVVHNYVNRGSVSIVTWLNDGISVPSSVAVNPGAGSLTITGYAPTVTQAANVAINPAAGSLAITGYAPTVARTANVALVPASGSMVITGYAPSVAQSVSDAVVGVVHTYVGRGSQQVVSWLNDGLSVPITPVVPKPDIEYLGGAPGKKKIEKGSYWERLLSPPVLHKLEQLEPEVIEVIEAVVEAPQVDEAAMQRSLENIGIAYKEAYQEIYLELIAEMRQAQEDEQIAAIVAAML